MDKVQLEKMIADKGGRWRPEGSELIFTKEEDGSIEVKGMGVRAWMSESDQEIESFRILSTDAILLTDAWKIIKFMKAFGQAVDIPIDDGSEGMTTKLAGETQLKRKAQTEKEKESGKVEALTLVIDKLLAKI